MTYETKNITFHVIRVKVSSKSRCSRTLPMNVAIESAQREREREREILLSSSEVTFHMIHERERENVCDFVSSGKLKFFHQWYVSSNCLLVIQYVYHYPPM